MMDFIDYEIEADYNYPHLSNTHVSPQTDVLSSYKCVLLNYPVNITNQSRFTYYSLWLLNSNILFPPSEFTPLHHVAYQLSQVILCVYVLICNKSVAGLIVLSLFALVQGLWGLFVLKSFDICVWNGVVLGVVLVRLSAYCCDGKGRKSPGGRRVKSSGRGVVVSAVGVKEKERDGGAELKEVYLRLFAPVRVSYRQFMKVVGCKRGFRVLACGENYAVEKRTRVDSLGLLVSGRLVVCQGGKPLHVILPFQFVDSPEFFGVATDTEFQVTISALEESKLLVWHRDKLRLTIMNDEFLNTIFQHILSRDVCRKLISVSDTMVTTTSLSSPSQTNTAISPSSSSNGTQLLTTLTPTHGTPQTTTTPQTQPIIMLRKEKYSYQPTYLTSLSEEKLNNGNKLNGGFNDVEDEYEEEEGDAGGLDTVVCGNEKEPMLVDGKGNGVAGGNGEI